MSDFWGMMILGGLLFLMFGVFVPWVFWDVYIRDRKNDESE